MRRYVRPDVPEILVERGADWTARWVRSRRTTFRWPEQDGVSVRVHLLPALVAMTDDHCAYCDWFPTSVGTVREIDHFRPASAFPELAFAWENLFLACSQCNRAKGDRFDERLLRPDADDHAFERYFVYDRRSGLIRPHPGASAADRDRAQVTIDLLQLNAEGRPEARRRELEHLRRFAAALSPEDLALRPFGYLQPLLADDLG